MHAINETLLAGYRDLKLRRKIRNFRRRKEQQLAQRERALQTYKQHGKFTPFNLPQPLNWERPA